MVPRRGGAGFAPAKPLGPLPSGRPAVTRPGSASRHLSAAASSRTASTEVELIWIERRLEHWLRFGRASGERIVSRSVRILCFRPGATLALVRWSANEFGTVMSRLDVLRCTAPGEPLTSVPFVRPGGELLLSVRGWPRVRQVLEAVDAIEAAGIDPCEVAPDHWRHIGNRLAASLPFRAYSRERHEAWRRRQALGQ